MSTALTQQGVHQLYVAPNQIDLGDGSDGALVFIYTGSTAVAGATLSGGTYTLTRDIFATVITIEPGVVINPSGYRIRCQGNIGNANSNSGNQTANPVISDNGNAAVTTVVGAALAASGTLARVSFVGGAQGLTGGGSNGTQATFPSFGGQGGQGGQGSQNTAGSQAGGVGQQSVVPSGVQGNIHNLQFVNLGLLGQGSGAQGPQFLAIFGGGGGGGGAGDGTYYGGSGGGGGGVIYIAARSITPSVSYAAASSTNSPSGGGAGGITIEALGGAGAGAQVHAGSQAGGGGGGGGGVIVLATVVPVNQGSQYAGVNLSVAGGAGGAAATTGTGNTAGVAGNQGNIYSFSPSA